MALTFGLDDNLRGHLWQAIQQHNAAGVDVLDSDPLLWIETQVGYWQAGHHIPGMFLLASNWTIPAVMPP